MQLVNDLPPLHKRVAFGLDYLISRGYSPHDFNIVELDVSTTHHCPLSQATKMVYQQAVEHLDLQRDLTSNKDECVLFGFDISPDERRNNPGGGKEVYERLTETWKIQIVATRRNYPQKVSSNYGDDGGDT